MNNERADVLTAQYVWTIQSEGDWYHRASQYAEQGEYGKFRRHTGNFINRVERQQGEKIQGIEWAFILLELWVGLGGHRADCLLDPGTLREQYLELLGQRDSAEKPSAAESEVVLVKRRKGDLFAKYGEVYTFQVIDTSRRGHTYTPKEVEALRYAYKIGAPFSHLAINLKRTALGIVEKMALLGLLEKNHDGDFVCALDVPDDDRQNETCNPCGEILLEVAAHCDLAAGHLDRVAVALETIAKEKSMTIATNPNTAIETRTIIFGQDAAAMSEQQLIDAIKKVEGQIAALKEVKTSSKKIAGNIKELEKQLDAIVAVLDAR